MMGMNLYFQSQVQLREELPARTDDFPQRAVPVGAHGTVLYEGLGGTDEDPMFIVSFEVGDRAICRAVLASQLRKARR